MRQGERLGSFRPRRAQDDQVEGRDARDELYSEGHPRAAREVRCDESVAKECAEPAQLEGARDVGLVPPKRVLEQERGERAEDTAKVAALHKRPKDEGPEVGPAYGRPEGRLLASRSRTRLARCLGHRVCSVRRELNVR